jgi:MurNAc alpha-1-phosphate uridylyltransferase
LPPLDEQIAKSMGLCREAPLAHLWLVPNPAHNPRGDFSIKNGLACPLLEDPLGEDPLGEDPLGDRPRSFTYSGIAILWPQLFADCIPGSPAPLGPLLRKACAGGQVSASLWPGAWVDVGAPERLQWLDQRLRSGGPLGHHE